jgi:ABC-type sugar transport system ATPase subunit
MLLEVTDLDAFYGDFQALYRISVVVDAGQCVALVGANGAGKTTFLNCVSGLIAEKRGAIAFDGNDILRAPAEAITRLGIALAPEGRMLFPSLNVEENLQIGGLNRRHGHWDLQQIYRLFPLLFRAPSADAKHIIRRRAGTGRDRPGADGQPATFALRRNIAWLGAGRGRSDLRVIRSHSLRRYRHRAGRTGCQARLLGV